MSAGAAAPRLTRPGRRPARAGAERPWFGLATFAALSLYGVLRWARCCTRRRWGGCSGCWPWRW